MIEPIGVVDGYKLVEEYKESLLRYWEDGHGDILILISELHGFLECLVRLNLIKQDDFMYTIDCFREEAKKIRKFK